MRVLPKLLGGANDDVDTVNSCVASKLGILDGGLVKNHVHKAKTAASTHFHVTSHICKSLAK